MPDGRYDLEKEPYDSAKEEEEDYGYTGQPDDALLTIDRSSNKIVNIYPIYKKKSVAIPMRDGNGRIITDDKNRPVIDHIDNKLVFHDHEREYITLPRLLDPNVPKSKLDPEDYAFIYRTVALTESLYMYQFREGISMTKSINFFQNLLMQFVHYRRALRGYGGLLSKSHVGINLYGEMDHGVREPYPMEEAADPTGGVAPARKPQQKKKRGENLPSAEQAIFGGMRSDTPQRAQDY